MAYSLSCGVSERLRFQRGDEIVLTVMEHHSNLVVWQKVRDWTGATLKVVDIRDDGTLDMNRLGEAITGRIRLVCCTHVSNVLGTINPLRSQDASPDGHWGSVREKGTAGRDGAVPLWWRYDRRRGSGERPMEHAAVEVRSRHPQRLRRDCIWKKSYSTNFCKEIF